MLCGRQIHSTGKYIFNQIKLCTIKNKPTWGFYATFMLKIGAYPLFFSLAPLGERHGRRFPPDGGETCAVYKNSVTANVHITTAITPSNICHARGRANTGIKNRAPNPRLENQITDATIAPSAK